MSATSEEIRYRIAADSNQYVNAFGLADKSTLRLDSSVSKLVGGLGGLSIAATATAAAIGAVVAATADGVKTGAEWERRLLRTESLIKATGNAAGLSATELSDFAKEMDLATLGDRDAIMDAINAMETFKSVSGETFKQAIRRGADLSEVFGTDLRSQVTQLGKALEDPINGMTALRRVGVSFTEQQKEMIKAMQEAGDLAGAQAEILKVLERQVGGAAAGAASGLTGKVDTLSFKFRQFKENLAATTGASKLTENAITGLSSALDVLNSKLETGPAADIKHRIEALQKSMEIARKSEKIYGPRPEHIANLQHAIDLERERLQILINTPESVYKYGEFGAPTESSHNYEENNPYTFVNGDMDAQVEAYRELQAIQQQIISDAKDAEINPLTFSSMSQEEQLDYTAEMEVFQEMLDYKAAAEYEAALNRYNLNRWLTDALISDEARKNKGIAKLQKIAAKEAWRNAGDALKMMGAQNKTAFELHKDYKTSEATVSGIDSAIKAWNAGMSTGGPWAPVVAAGYATASLLKTGALITSIQSTQYGGGGGQSASGGGSSAQGFSSSVNTETPKFDPAIADDTDNRPHMTIHVDGPFTNEETADYIWSIAKEAYEERDLDMVFATSKQD